MVLSCLAAGARALLCRAHAHRALVQPRRGAGGWKHTVRSPAMDQLDRYCERVPPPPQQPPFRKMTILGAANPVALITALFLKQQNIIQLLAMYDDCNVCGYANDLAHIDTSTAIEAYNGRPALQQALEDSAVVLLCTGCQWQRAVCPAELLLYNARVLNSLLIAIAEFCPKSIVCLQTPPVEGTFRFCKQVLMKHKAYDKRRLLGVNALAAMRANRFYCELKKEDPLKSFCPCVGGTSGTNVVPAFSSMEGFVCMAPEAIDTATKLVRDADQTVLNAKCCNDCLGTHLSTGFSTARFVVNVMKGIYGGGKTELIDSAFVQQATPEACFGMKYCACPVRIGRNGIDSYLIPKLNEKERNLLKACRKNIEDCVRIGKNLGNGDDVWFQKFKQEKTNN